MSAVRTLWIVWLVLAAASNAQQKDLTSLTLEDFLNVEVTSVDKSPQKLSRSAAAVFVITQDDILRSGANSLPEVLRLAPGVSVSNVSGSEWAISIRGFGNLYSNKLLVMIDGRTIYSALLSGTIWGENMVVLEDIERIEVIRGPGATMWGANAVSGVINIITKSSKSTTGGMAAVSGGNYNRLRTRVRYGANLGENGAWRGWAQYGLQGQASIPDLNRDLSPWSTVRGGLRFDWDSSPQNSFLMEGEVQRTSSESALVTAGPGASLLNTFHTSTASGFLMGRWRHENRRGDESKLQLSFNDESMDAVLFSARVRTLDLDWDHTMRLGRAHSLVFGGGARVNMIGTDGTPAFRFEPAGRTYGLLNAFVQDEWELKPDKLELTVGVKAERYTMAGTAIQPTARLMWTPTARLGYWISVSRAVRTPAHTDYALRVPVSLPGMPFGLELTGSDLFQPEVLNAFEAGTRFRVGRSWAFDIAAFHHRYTGLHSYFLPTFSPADLAGLAAGLPVTIPAITTNGMDGRNQGLEAVVQYEVRPGWRFSGSYSSLFATTRFHPGFSAANAFALPTYTPEHQGYIRSSWDFARHWTADATLYRIGALPDGALPAYTRLDCRVARTFGESVEFSVSGQHLLRPEQREFAGDLVYPAGLVHRGIEAGLRWNF